jgi:CheY-like chemotaxis protein
MRAVPGASAVRTAPRSVLVVDDDHDIRMCLGEVLHEQGFVAVTAADGRDALRKLSSRFRPDAIVLDLMMPVMNGFEFLEAVRADKDLEQIPVVVISANRGYDEHDLGVSAVLRKPFDLGALVEAIERAI